MVTDGEQVICVPQQEDVNSVVHAYSAYPKKSAGGFAKLGRLFGPKLRIVGLSEQSAN